MRKINIHDALLVFGMVVCFIMLMQGWENVMAFLGIFLSALVPLVLGVAIAYIVSIPTNFFERHILPNNENAVVAGIRRPLSLLIAALIAITAIFFSTSVLAPALIETVAMVQRNGQQFVEDVIALPAFSPVRESIHSFLEGDFIQSLKNLDINGVIKGLFSGTVGTVTTHVFTVVSTVMTGFFGMLFSFILLTDTTQVGDKIMGVIVEYLGPKRTERFALVMGVADASFHNFIVRQFLEAMILGAVGTTVLLISGYPYALGTGVLLGLAALVPIVGYPIGLFVGAFMVAINGGWTALLFIVCVAIAQLLESTFVLPHIGDPRTVLPPVWITVAVTIGGGVAGFIGMLVAIPIASTIYQLIVIDINRRHQKSEASGASLEVEAAETRLTTEGNEVRLEAAQHLARTPIEADESES